MKKLEIDWAPEEFVGIPLKIAAPYECHAGKRRACSASEPATPASIKLIVISGKKELTVDVRMAA